MFIPKSTFDLGKYKLHVNAYWITISNNAGDVIFERRADHGPWLDEQHEKITNALDELERVLSFVVGK